MPIDTVVLPTITSGVAPVITSGSPTDEIKILLSGVVLAISILMIAYYAFKHYQAKYKERMRKKDQESRPYTTYEDTVPITIGVNKKIYLIVGLCVVVVGIIQMLL